MSIVREEIGVDTPSGSMGVRISRPDLESRHPLLVFFHRGPGFDEGSWWAMDQFAAAGFFVVAPDRYHRIDTWPWIDTVALRAAGAGSSLQQRFHRMLGETTEDVVAEDVDALLSVFRGDARIAPGAYVSVGYCIGARSVIRMMRDRPRCVAGAALQPSQCVTDAEDSPHRQVPQIAGELYVAIGAADRHAGPEVSAPLIEAVQTLGPRGRVQIYEGAEHGFTLPGAGFLPETAARVNAAVREMFAAALSVAHDDVRGGAR